MANVAVIGAQWGDEGKGKIVDWLSERAEVVVRFQGGHNAGHTLVIGNQTYKLALLPSGVVRQGKLSIIGNGVVIDPWHFLDEVKRVSEQGVSVTPASLKIANHAVLILPLHRDLDGWREDAPGIIKIGTTRRGIGPAYEDKVGRRAIRVGDWKLVAAKDQPWALYDLRTDRAEQNDLSAKMPDKAKELAALWQKQTDETIALAKLTMDEQPRAKAKATPKKAK